MMGGCASSVLLRAEDLRVQRGGQEVLDIPQLTLREGEVLALIGPNGAGKTTLLLALALLVEPCAGRIFFEGRPVKPNDVAYRRQTAFVFQEPLLFDATVLENVAAGLRIRGWERRRIEEEAVRYAGMLGLSHLADRSARKLSGGEARRTSLARAFATSPRILFLDEPFSSLDPPTREALLEDLEGILRGRRITTVLATHDRSEALRLADNLAVMNGGRIIQMGSVAEVMNRPADELVASYVGAETVLSGRVAFVSDGLFAAAVEGGEIKVAGRAEEGEEVLCCIRPEYVTVAADGALTYAGDINVFGGTIMKITPLEGGYRLLLDCGFRLVAHVPALALQEMCLAEGREVTASFKAAAVHVMSRLPSGGKSGQRPANAQGSRQTY